jgi:hypothetical protein
VGALFCSCSKASDELLAGLFVARYSERFAQAACQQASPESPLAIALFWLLGERKRRRGLVGIEISPELLAGSGQHD